MTHPFKVLGKSAVLERIRNECFELGKLARPYAADVKNFIAANLATKVARKPLVEFDEASHTWMVCGNRKGRLREAQDAVVKALLAAGEGGLRKAELEKRSNKDGAVKILRALRRKDNDWNHAIMMPGKPNGPGYRIRHA